MGDKHIQWMYEGPKSHVSREDYLLGKKIDKNFELYSDVIVKERDEVEELIKKKARMEKSVKDLPASVARQEDPLAVLRLKQVQEHEKLMSDPKFLAKAEKLMRKEAEKAKRKADKKRAKKKHKEEQNRHREKSPRNRR